MMVRQAGPQDAAAWCDLVKVTLGEDYPDKRIYDAQWVAGELDPAGGHETWITEVSGAIQASVTVLRPTTNNLNPVTNVGRNLFRPEAFTNESAETLYRKIVELAGERKCLMVVRVLVSESAQQQVLEKIGFVCAGYQPSKHMHRVRLGTLFYVYERPETVAARLPVSESLSQINELASKVLAGLGVNNPITVRDGVTGYPLQTEVQIHEATPEDYELWREEARKANPPLEISGGFNQGVGLLRTASTEPARALLAQRGSDMTAGLAYVVDEHDRCIRMVDSFATDDLSTGALFNHVVKQAQTQFNSIYVETDILMTAPRLLKAAEQLGFVPVAYLPALSTRAGGQADVVKLIKLNMVYSQEEVVLSTQARAIVEVINQNFQDQKMGVAIINLLRGLPIFDGLGDGELRKVARLFIQKLFRAGEKLFKRGDSGSEAYVVMRGQIDILLEDGTPPLASVTNGQIFGELAFLDGAARTANAVAVQPSILLVIQRAAFYELAQREPHLGMMIMRNIGLILSDRMRKSGAAAAGKK